MDKREYLSLRGNGVELYIEKALVNELPEDGGRINVYMGDYGCWTIGVTGKSV